MPSNLWVLYNAIWEGMDFAGRAKHDAWAKLKGMSKEEVMQAYVDLVAKLKG